MRVLIIEANDSINKILLEGLMELGYQADETKNLKDAKYYTKIRHYNLVLISDEVAENNIILNIIKAVKNKTQNAIIIMNTKDDSLEKEQYYFGHGVDDLLIRPFKFDVLIAKLESRMRFGGTNVIEFKDLIIDPDIEKVYYEKKEIDLKGKPFEILMHLARHCDQIISKEQLLDAIWEEPELVTPNVIEVAINQIRQKMDKALKIEVIETVRRRGYRFCYADS